MFDTGIVEEPVEGARVISITEKWVVTTASDLADAMVSAVVRCADPRLVCDDGTFGLTVDVRRNVDRATVKVDLVDAKRRFDMDGRC